MTDAKILPPAVRAWAQGHIGPITAVRDVSHRRTASRVWELVRPGGRAVYLKIAAGPVPYQRESFAYRSAVPALGSGAAPQLVESSAEHFALLVTAIPGRPLAELPLAPAEELEAYRQAGVLLARLHAAGDLRGVHRVEAEEALHRAASGVDRHLAAAGDRLSAPEQQLVRRLAEELLLVGSVPLAFLHGDAWARNVLWSDRSAWVDFERARFGAAVQDFVVMSCGVWADNPRLRTAFFRGYGRELSPAERHALTCLAALDAASCLAWAPEHGDIEVADRGRKTLDRLMTGGFA
ncbi:hypothetical protein GCM10011579_064760 [Streptomyces albiflavescens]|uniref:Aminoglycoside phosphotransferase domain-containing protein n=1 Tax=Streptomyces albiflavescens TaxID=1623582 RepID=A0A918D7I6_9ACTN|nr:aminoglycoside phosphotransferase family protein [Streptomyces albiflavescens]GGN79847.1 hypothetical protein GCM10011579_064760 [Streptomyces albiflavescens]